MTKKSADTLPEQVDLLVIGSGVGGMTAAIAGALEGLSVLLIEKQNTVGGTSARSAGSVWLPNTHLNRHNNDSFDNALAYLRASVGNRLDHDRARAFLHAAPEMMRRLESEAGLAMRAYPYHPDYLAELDGATLAGRVLEPEPFDAAVLGDRFSDLAPPLPEFTLFGGMMVDRTDINHLLSSHKRLSSFAHSVRLLVRYGFDRLRFPRGRRLVMGNALTGRLYHALQTLGVPVHLGVTTRELLMEGGRIAGARIVVNGDERTVYANAGVILATGGFSHHTRLRSKLHPKPIDTESAVAEGATGDGIELATPFAAGLSTDHVSNSFLAPVSYPFRADGSRGVFPHFVLDRGKPGAIAIAADGKRFVNEATTYQRFGEALIATMSRTGGSCYLICDAAFVKTYGIGVVRPRALGLKAAVESGYLLQAANLAELARNTGVAESSLADTVERYAGFADSGVDQDFDKGADAYQKNLGDAANKPNPCIRALGAPPYYALELRPGDIGASSGLVCNASSCVLDDNGQPIPGLYACGADMASLMAGCYPGPGITLGPAMVFGYLAACHAAESIANATGATDPGIANSGRSANAEKVIT